MEFIQSIAMEVPSLHRRLLSALGSEIARSQVTMMMLGTMGARERLVDFLLERFQAIPCAAAIPEPRFACA